jgi:hypothetical protein
MAESRSAPLLALLNAPAVAAYTAAGFWGDEAIYHLRRGTRGRCCGLGSSSSA